jgi:nicotinate-nucleotide--dimethylbenzimidazole phosphoribosyltransferase
MASGRSLVSPTSSPALERALGDKLQRRKEAGGSLGELEPLAIRLGLMQNSLKPRLHDPQLLVFAADHGLAVDGIQPPGSPRVGLAGRTHARHGAHAADPSIAADGLCTHPAASM